MIRYGSQLRSACKDFVCGPQASGSPEPGLPDRAAFARSGMAERAGFARAGVEEPSPASHLLKLLPVAISAAEVILIRAPKARKRALFARLAHPEGERMRAEKGG